MFSCSYIATPFSSQATKIVSDFLSEFLSEFMSEFMSEYNFDCKKMCFIRPNSSKEGWNKNDYLLTMF